MRRLLTFVVLILSSLPIGISVAGCSKGVTVTYCNGGDTGPVVGQVTTIDLEPRLTGISLNQGQIGTVSTPTAKDCKANTASVTSYTYGSTNNKLVDVVPTSGALCAGTWKPQHRRRHRRLHRLCTPGASNGVAYITASAGTAASNALPVFVHPVGHQHCARPGLHQLRHRPRQQLYRSHPAHRLPHRNPHRRRQLYRQRLPPARARQPSSPRATYAGSGASQTNISCLVGPLTFTASNPTTSSSATSVVTIDQNGVATAAQPGAALINANISQSSSTTGFFATCPPKSIVLTARRLDHRAHRTHQHHPERPAGSRRHRHRHPRQPHHQRHPHLRVHRPPDRHRSRSHRHPRLPRAPPAASSPPSASPSTCNTAPFNQIGLFGNGLPVTSNNVLINATGTGNSTVLYIASTGSQYIQPYDFTVSTQPAGHPPPVRP